MAITSKISATMDAVSGADTAFTTTTRGFWLYGDGFAHGESAVVMRPNVAGNGFVPATSKGEVIGVSATPNIVFVDLPAGTYRINKTATAAAAAVGYEEEA